MASWELLHPPLSPSLCVLAWMNAFLTHLSVFIWASMCMLKHRHVNIYKSSGDKLLSHKKTAISNWLSLHIYMLFLFYYPSHSIASSLSHFILVSLSQKHSLPLSATPFQSLYSSSPHLSPMVKCLYSASSFIRQGSPTGLAECCPFTSSTQH